MTLILGFCVLQENDGAVVCVIFNIFVVLNEDGYNSKCVLAGWRFTPQAALGCIISPNTNTTSCEKVSRIYSFLTLESDPSFNRPSAFTPENETPESVIKRQARTDTLVWRDPT